MKPPILLLSVLLVFALDTFAQNNIEPPLITVTGQAEMRAAPDEVLFTLAVENIDRDISTANKKTDDSIKQILAIARKHQVSSDDVQTSHINIQPKYNTDDLEYEARRNVKRVLIGYEAAKTVAIRLRDISRFEELAADVLEAGITRLSNVQFRTSKLRQLRDEARRMAIRAAQEKATLLAREIGQSIGPAYSITEDADYSARSASQNVSGFSDSGRAESDSALAPGTISVTANVTVRFRLQ